jgi:hypothetical protein
MRIEGTVIEVIRDALMLLFAGGLVPLWIASEIFGLVVGGPLV